MHGGEENPADIVSPLCQTNPEAMSNRTSWAGERTSHFCSSQSENFVKQYSHGALPKGAHGVAGISQSLW